MSCKINQELKEILSRFAQSGQEPLASSSADYLSGKGSARALMDAIAQDGESRGPLYPRAIELLRQETRVSYGKLVRDRIPEIILREGFTPETRILEEGEYVAELNRKLREETAEYLESGELEELADIQEVVEALCKAKGFSVEDLARIKAEKQAARGAFDKHIYLIAKQ